MMLQNLSMIVTATVMLFQDFIMLLIEMDKGICLFDAVLCCDNSGVIRNFPSNLFLFIFMFSLLFFILCKFGIIRHHS